MPFYLGRQHYDGPPSTAALLEVLASPVASRAAHRHVAGAARVTRSTLQVTVCPTGIGAPADHGAALGLIVHACTATVPGRPVTLRRICRCGSRADVAATERATVGRAGQHAVVGKPPRLIDFMSGAAAAVITVAAVALLLPVLLMSWVCPQRGDAHRSVGRGIGHHRFTVWPGLSVAGRPQLAALMAPVPALAGAKAWRRCSPSRRWATRRRDRIRHTPAAALAPRFTG